MAPTPTLGSIRLFDRADRLGAGWVFLVVAVPLFVLYLATATWSYPLINDATTNTTAAWALGTGGSVLLDEVEELEQYYAWHGWFVPARDSVASKYPPGTALVAAPLYAVLRPAGNEVTFGPEDIPDEWRLDETSSVTFTFAPVGPATTTAAATTAAAIGLLAVVFHRLGGSTRMAIIAAYLAGLGTGAWPVAADQLWQHGPAMAWIGLAFVLAPSAPVGSGLAYGAMILTRPPLAVIAAGAGLFQAWKERSVRPAVRVGMGAAAGLVAFLAYNWWLFGSPSVSAGYGTGFQDRFFSVSGVGFYLRTLYDALVSAEVGVLVWSPFLLVLIPGLRSGWRTSPPWARGAALGGIVYLLIQFKANRATGGEFIGYRYPLEALTAAAPVLFLAYRERIASWPSLRRYFAVAAIAAVTINGLAAVGIGVL